MTVPVFKDRIRVVAEAIDCTGDFQELRAINGSYRTMAAAAIPDGSTVHYSAYTENEFETGEGIYDSATGKVTRATIYASSNGGQVVSFGEYVEFVVDFLAADALTPRFNSITLDDVTITELVTEAEGLDSSDNDISVPTTAAVIDFVETSITAEDLDFAGDSGVGSVDLDGEVLLIDTSNDSLVTAALNQTLTISLADVLEDIDTLGPNAADGEFLVGTAAGALAWESGNVARTSLELGTGNSPTFTDLTLSNDLLLASGSIVNFNSGDITLTHSLNALTMAGGSLVLPAAGLTVGASIPFSDASGVLTLQNIDALDATTEATVENAIDALPNLASINSQAVSFSGSLTVEAASVLNQDLTSDASPTFASITVTGTVDGRDVSVDGTKLDLITVTQAVDLDAIEARVNDLDASVVLRGLWDASAGTFPDGSATPDGATKAGDSYIVSVGGTVDGEEFNANDRLIAIVDAASTTTYAANWHRADYTDEVVSVFSRTGAITAQAGDYEDGQITAAATATNYTPVTPDVEAHLAGIDTAMGGKQPLDADLTAIAALDHTDQHLIVGSGTTWVSTAAASVVGTAMTAASAITDLADTDEFGVLDASSSNALVPITWASIKAEIVAEMAGSTLQAFDELLNEIAALSTDPGADSGLFFDDSAGAIAYWTPANGLEFSGTSLQVTMNLRGSAIEFVIDGGGSVITSGVKGFLEIPYNCTITQATALADQSGSIVVDIWVGSYASYPPTDADSITASAPVTITAATDSQDSTLTGWTTSLSAGDIIGFNVDSVTTVERVTVSLKVTI